jgi:energy-coupling factor transporter ATP-binding protein EcfA2
MRRIDIFNEKVKKGLRGSNYGIRYTVDKLNRYITITPGTYVLLVAQSGVGKSLFMYGQYIYNTLSKIVNNKEEKDVKILLFNFEISEVNIIGILFSSWLFDYTKGKIITDTRHIFSKEDKSRKVNPKIIEYMNHPEWLRFMDEYEKRVISYQKATVAEMRYHIDKLAKSRGNIVTNGNNIGYAPNNEKEIVLILVDHIGLVSCRKQDKYSEMTSLSEYLANTAVNVYNYSPIVLQQVAGEKQTFKDKDRVSLDMENLRFGQETYHDSDVVLTIGSPFKLEQSTYLGYKIKPSEFDQDEFLGDRFRVIQVKKNRDGPISNKIPALFIGECGKFFNIEAPSSVQYSKYMNMKKTF